MSKTQYAFTATPDTLSFRQIENDNYDKLFYVVEGVNIPTQLALDKGFAMYIDSKNFLKCNDYSYYRFYICSSIVSRSATHKVWFSIIENKKAKPNAMKFITFVNKLRVLAKEYEALKTQDMKVKVRF